MSESNDTAAEPVIDPFELAATVSQRVQIRSIILAESHLSRSPDTGPKGRALRREFQISEVVFGRPSNPRLLMVKPRFSLRVFAKPTEGEESEDGSGETAGSIVAVNKETKPYLSIEATFVLTYSAESFEDLSDENLQAFATTNGVYNAWPYWREYVQSTVTRMGFPPIVVPVFRL